MITCEHCGSAEQVRITRNPSGAPARWHGLCGACDYAWDFDD